MSTRTPILRLGTAILLFITLFVATATTHADDLGPDNSGCLGAGCPATATYPQGPATYGSVDTDEAYTAVIGGNWTLGDGAAEGEGRIVVLGDLTVNKSSGLINTGYVGVGSYVVPPDGSQSLIIGGDATFNTSVNIQYGGVVGADNIPLAVVHKGSISNPGGGNFVDGSFPPAGTVTANASLDLTPYQAIIADAANRGRCWNGLAESANGTFSDLGGGTYRFESTDNASGLYVFNIPASQSLDPGFSGTAQFVNFPDDATILINVLGTNRTLNLGSFAVNGTTMGVGPIMPPQPVAERILWNFPEATSLTLNGASQFWGSVVAPLADVTMSTSTNGRLIIGGNLDQGTAGGTGLEIHNYPFRGSLPGCDWGDLPDTGTGTGTGDYQTNGSDNGASHMVTSNTPFLGACVDGETNGQQTSNALGDNGNGSNLSDTTGIDSAHVNVSGTCGINGDEDGVSVANGSGGGGQWQDGANGGSINVTGTNGACLNGWIDWNGDGDFGDTNEQVASDFALDGSIQNVQFTIPAGTYSNNSSDPNVVLYSRFRVTENCGTSDYIDPSSGTAVAPTPNGPATNGEVEDYRWEFTPTAVSMSNMSTASHTNTLWLPAVALLLLTLTTCGMFVRRNRA